MQLVILFLTCLTAWVTSSADDGSCVLSTAYKVGDLKEPQPLIYARNSSVAKIVYPVDKKGTLKFSTGRDIYLSCPGKNNSVRNTTSSNEVKAVCVKDKIFKVGEQYLNFSSLVCRYMPEHHARRIDSCLREHSLVEIGFNLTGEFLRMIELCRNDRTYTTYYAKFRMTKRIAAAQKGYPRPWKWSVGQYFPNVDVDRAYVFDNQFNTIAKILNSTELAKKYLMKTSQYLSRGHLVPKGDLMYGAMQSATFWYLNAAPQWQTFNGGNWNSLEMSVRTFASNSSLDLDIYTGVYGQMTLIDVHGKRQPIRLHANSADILPVPRFYWKVIYDPMSKRGTAFVGLNDPFVESITKDIYVCPDISPIIEWLRWNASNVQSGISYACTVDNLRKAIPTVPALDVIGILR